MKKYHIENRGCDDTTEFDIELTDEEYKTIIKLFDANNKEADYDCKPDLYIYDFIENETYYWNEKPLNKSHKELVKEGAE